MSMKKYAASTYEKAADETLRSAYRMCEQRIAEAVAAERERCAKVAEERIAHLKEWEQQPHPDNPDEAAETCGAWMMAEYIAESIRAGAGEEEVVR